VVSTELFFMNLSEQRQIYSMRGGGTFTWFVLGFGILALAALIFGAAFLQEGGGIMGGYQGCEPPVPPWKFWCPKDGVVSLQDETAMNSVKALACAINSVAGGKKPNSETCPGAESSVTAGFLPVVSAANDDVCFGDLEEACVSCLDKSTVTSETEVWTKRFFSNADSYNELHELCKGGCKGEEKCKAEKVKDSEEKVYYPREMERVVKCDCRYFDVDSKWKHYEGSVVEVEHISFSGALELCAKGAESFGSKFEIYSCSEEISSNVNYYDMWKDSETGFSGQKCTCRLDGPSGEVSFSVYGEDSDSAEGFCRMEMEESSESLEQENPSNYDSNYYGYYYAKECSTFSGGVVFSPKIYSSSDEYTCKKTLSTANLDCTVTNFQLPQDFKDDDGNPLGDLEDFAKIYIGHYGDPKYLIYFQSFPQGEDIWNQYSHFYGSAGKVFLWGMCLSHAVPIVKAVSTSFLHPFKTGAALASKGGKLVGSSMSKLKNYVNPAKGVDDFVFVGVKGGKVGAKTAIKANQNLHLVDDYIKQDKSADDFIADALRKEPGLSSSAQSTLKNNFNKYKNALKNGNNIKVDSSELAMGNYLSTATSSQVFGTFLKNWAAEGAASSAKFTGLSLPLYMLLRSSSELGKFLEREGSSIVLQKSFRGEDRDDFRTAIKIMGSRLPASDSIKNNVVDIAKPIEFEKPELIDGGVSRMGLASPCRSDFDIYEKNIHCSFYSYDLENDVVTCDAPYDDTWYNKCLGVETRKCGSLDTVFEEEYRLGFGGGNDYLNTVKDFVNDMDSKISFGDATLTMADKSTIVREKLIEPIHEAVLYFDKEKKYIDWVDGGEGIVHNSYYLPCEKIEDKFLYYDSGLILKHLERGMGVYNGFYGTYRCTATSVKSSDDISLTVYAYANVLENGEWSFFSIINRYTHSLGHDAALYSMIVFNDLNEDNKIDSVKHIEKINLNTNNGISFIATDFQDFDFDGTTDFVNFLGESRDFDETHLDSWGSCTVDAIVVEPNMDKYEDEQPNFCYRKSSDGAVALAGTALAVAGTAVAKVSKVGGVWGWALATGIDCGLAYTTSKLIDLPWPGEIN